MTDSNIIMKELSSLAHRMFINGEGDVYVYGSRVRGTASDSSDWDILVIIDDNLSSNDDFMRFAFPFAEIGWKFGEQITPLHYTRSQWAAQRNTAFHNNVTSESIRL